MAKRLIIAVLLINFFYYIYPRPRLWLSVNFIGPQLIMWEYAGMQRGIINKIGLGYMQQNVEGRVADWRYLVNNLIQRLSSRRLCCLCLGLYHLTVLLLPRIKIMIALTVIFVFIVSYKIYRMDKFIREFE